MRRVVTRIRFRRRLVEEIAEVFFPAIEAVFFVCKIRAVFILNKIDFVVDCVTNCQGSEFPIHGGMIVVNGSILDAFRFTIPVVFLILFEGAFSRLFRFFR